MNIFSLFKRKPQKPSINTSQNTCSKLVHIGQELETLLRADIFSLLHKHYPKLLDNSISEKHASDKKVFEAATIGTAIIDLVEYCEESSQTADLVTTVIAHLKQIFIDPEKACVYNHAMKFVYDYKHFKEDEISKKFASQKILLTTFIGAWVTRYYLGDQETIINTSALEIGAIIQDHLGDIWNLLAKTN